MVVYAPVCFGAQDAHEVIEHKGEESLITAFAAFTLFGVAHRDGSQDLRFVMNSD